MRKLLMLCAIIGLHSTITYAQLNVVLLNQLVSESESEYNRQTQARTLQATASATEVVNKNKMGDLKTTYRDIQSRFSKLGLIISMAQVGLEAIPILNEILSQQEKIIDLAGKQPLLILLAANSEADLADQAQLLIAYSYGLVLSIGDINQMKASDRKMLFAYIVTELRRIDGASRGLLIAMTNFYNQMNGKLNAPFSGFINQDKHLVDDIMNNWRNVKQ